MKTDLISAIENKLQENKAFDVKNVDFNGKSDIVDCALIASGNSAVHVRAIAKNIVEDIKKDLNIRPLRIEDDVSGEWIVIDYADIMLHILQPQIRGYYELEKFWENSKVNND